VEAQWQVCRKARSDSSISGRMACRSSLAEITGNSRTSAQPRTQKKMSGDDAGLSIELPARLRAAIEKLRCRQSRYPGNSKDSQQRLRKSSIPNTQVFGGDTTTWWDYLKIIKTLMSRTLLSRIPRIAQGRQVTCVPCGSETRYGPYVGSQ
jgi:hypothetical protein